ncbi:MAG: translation initiation factor IF-2 [Oscillospiraceae bacterium]|jgi:translation initiation factor IF-2|nr:translation initiation factor IF-2 [Oscillospiraceae bacterium]
MAKLKVQEAAKELGTSAGVLLESVGRTRKSANDTLQYLKRIEAQFLKLEEKRKEDQRLEAYRQLLDKQKTAWIMPDPDEAAIIAQSEAADAASAEQTLAQAPEVKPAEAPIAAAAIPAAEAAAVPAAEAETAPSAGQPRVVEPVAAAAPEPERPAAETVKPDQQVQPADPARPAARIDAPAAQAQRPPERQAAQPSPAAQSGATGPTGAPTAPAASGQPGDQPRQGKSRRQRERERAAARAAENAARPNAAEPVRMGQFITRPAPPAVSAAPTGTAAPGSTAPGLAASAARPAPQPGIPGQPPALRPGIQAPPRPAPPPVGANGLRPGIQPGSAQAARVAITATPRPYGNPPPQRPFAAPGAGAVPTPRPYGQPPAPGARPMGGQGGIVARPYGQPPRPGMPGATAPRPFGAAGAPRPGMAPRPGAPGAAGRPPMAAGAGRFGKKGPELTPTVEKERVSNYDPNKKLYQRQHDPERVARNRKQLARDVGSPLHDDDVMRGGKNRRKRDLSAQQMMDPIRIEKAYMTADTITVKDLTERIGKSAGEIMKKLMLLGTMATINQELDFDTAQLVCSEFGVELEMKLDKTAEDQLSDEDFTDAEDSLAERPPVVTIMGHVDHGKTSLLDYIRKTRVAEGEAGGITQHIGAYTVTAQDRQITFLDTPGHEAFTAMRARGAQATDIAVLVVAADDGVMPQTLEAISHAKAASVPIIVAINKIDKAGANADRVRQDLTNRGLVPEEWGGDTIMAPVSAVTGEGVSNLLDMILLVADLAQLRANPNRRARGVIIEARLDKGRGPVATALVQNGTLRIGDTVVAGTSYGRVRAMVNDRGQRVNEAGPSTPVEIIGFGEVPDAGDEVSAVEDASLSRLVAEERKSRARTALVKSSSAKASLDDLFTQISEGQIKDLNLIVKADVQGSVEAVKQSMERLTMDEVRVRVIHGGVGAITENDVMLASTSNAIIIGFNVRPDAGSGDLAKREGIDLRLYRVIYEAINDVEKAMKGLLAPQFREVSLGKAQVRMTFKVTGVGTIAGCYVTEGKMLRSANARLLRDHVTVFEGKIASLKHLKDDAREIAQGFECGVGLEKYNDVKEGDEIECFTQEEIIR